MWIPAHLGWVKGVPGVGPDLNFHWAFGPEMSLAQADDSLHDYTWCKSLSPMECSEQDRGFFAPLFVTPPRAPLEAAFAAAPFPASVESLPVWIPLLVRCVV
uniref:Uncharacterized protein n=1 Tax=Sphaerodactylus townsendi TaxID=933632 RepID=A0ACB8FZ46_9SAUR